MKKDGSKLRSELRLMSGKKLVYSIIGLVVEYIVAIDVTRVRFPDDAFLANLPRGQKVWVVCSRFWKPSL